MSHSWVQISLKRRHTQLVRTDSGHLAFVNWCLKISSLISRHQLIVILIGLSGLLNTIHLNELGVDDTVSLGCHHCQCNIKAITFEPSNGLPGCQITRLQFSLITDISNSLSVLSRGHFTPNLLIRASDHVENNQPNPFKEALCCLSDLTI